MIRGLYTSALGMITQMNRMDAVSNNVANVNTTGFKRDISVPRAFSEELMKRLDDSSDYPRHDVPAGRVSLGVFVDDIHTDFSNGSLRETGGRFDVALSGSGFFVINVRDQEGNDVERYTRDGSFTLAADGTLMTKEGNRVAGQNGNIVLPNGEVNIHENGDIYVNQQLVDRLMMVDFTDLHSLRKIGDNLYRTTDESEEADPTAIVVQGYLENSNANSVREMVDMIAVARAYDANQRMILSHDSTLNRAVNDIGRR